MPIMTSWRLPGCSVRTGTWWSLSGRAARGRWSRGAWPGWVSPHALYHPDQVCLHPGGLLLGPIGLALGGAVGGAMAAVWAGDKFRPLHQVITEEMTQHQRDRMVECLRNVLTNIGIADDSSHILYFILVV